jgi:hypothetical protein
MGPICSQDSLKQLAQTIEALDLNKRIAAAKWLEGVIIVQILSDEERQEIVQAANDYIGDVAEGEYADAVNVLTSYLEKVQRRARRALKKRNNDGSTGKRR